ncbi:NAD(P)/FAD-dependent oxidoreductase [Aestuariibius sp. 2305UL40-4]|uniref:NAD(P)/FAD-dependent oxidoreductase n=1 Tax=Aestuariibius violaceus TaxID=3234132 RepID=UPI00345E2A37
MTHIVIIGAGQAGSALAARLRSKGFDGDITLVGQETAPPYQRPPLSKAYLLGEMDEARLYLRPPGWYSDNRIDLRTGVTATKIDPNRQKVTLDTGETLRYDELALTTGAQPIPLPEYIAGDLWGILTIRTLGCADGMAPYLKEGDTALVVGGGYIGLEAAAVAAKKGLNVTLVEQAPRILQRVAARETSDYFRDLHRSHGVTIKENCALTALSGDRYVRHAILSDGTEMDIDCCIVGIGIQPDTALAEVGGLQIDKGILTDEMGRTSAPNIWAAGDCASLPFRGERIRIESVQNAIDQAEAVADNMLGADEPYRPKPWFWSDQYDVKLQIAGLNNGYDDVVVRRGDKPGAASHWYYGKGKLLAVDAMNDPRAYMIGKRLIEAGRSPAPEALGQDDLRSLLAA